MKINRWMPVWNAEGGNGGGGDGNAAPADPNAAPPADPNAAPPADPNTGAGKWWEDNRLNDDVRKHLTVKGLTVDDPIDAMVKLAGMHRNAESRLGRDPATLIDRPKQDQPITDWMKANREMFGLPEAADGYKIDKPADWPKDAKWDDSFEAEARAFAFEHGIPPDALNGLVSLYAGKVAALDKDASDTFNQANTQMMSELQKDWGGETDARIARATQAARIAAEQAGMTGDQVEAVARTLSKSGGDANVIRMFEAFGAMMGDDQMMGAGKGSTGFGTTPAEARQQIATLHAPGGDWFEATKSGDAGRIKALKPKMDQLYKLAAN